MHDNAKKPEGYRDSTPMGFARRQGVSLSTVYNLLRTGKLKAKKVGSRTFISEQAEQEWLDSLPDYPCQLTGRQEASR